MRKAVIDLLKGLTYSQKSNLKVMLSHNVICYADYAKEHGLDINLFNKELKTVLV